MLEVRSLPSQPVRRFPIRVLVACEYSGRVRDAFLSRGHDAWSCDVIPSDADPTYHIQGDVLGILDQDWDLMVAHPPCTYLSCAGVKWWHTPGRAELREAALEFVQALMDAPIPRIAIENPQGAIGSHIRKADQYIQPWEHGDPYIKKTGLWLKNLPLLVPSRIVEPIGHWMESSSVRKRGGLPVNFAGKSPKMRSLTFAGVAEAMADQWGGEAAELPLAA
jgi:hypothetical protein